MPLPKDEELERRYRSLFDNKEIQDVVHARTPNNASPIDENAILQFVQKSDESHATYVRSVLSRYPNLDK